MEKNWWFDTMRESGTLLVLDSILKGMTSKGSICKELTCVVPISLMPISVVSISLVPHLLEPFWRERVWKVLSSEKPSCILLTCSGVVWLKLI